MSGKSQTVWDFTVSRPSQILPTNENSTSYISPIVWDERGQIWRVRSVSIFPTRLRFLRWSANSNLYRPGHRHPSVMDFAHYQSPNSPGHNQNWIYSDVIELHKMAPTLRGAIRRHISALFSALKCSFPTVLWEPYL